MVDRIREALLGVWQEACRHIEIHESTANIAEILQDQMPLRAVIVRQLDLSRHWVDTVAVGPANSREAFQPGRTQYSSTEMKRVGEWCRRGTVDHIAAGKRPRTLPVGVIPAVDDVEVLVGPLVSGDRLLGVLILVAGDTPFERHHVPLMQELLEPFTVALENDHRLRELAALRNAAEADKASLLARLGRTEVGSTIVGVDGGLRTVMERVQLVSKSDVPVLILGETGTGKEVVARAIHTGSPRSQAPFIRVNCGAIPHELIDSQLFGHERGSFTGATDTRKGWFERADGGTLFLDEIGELTPAAQVRLLRILQDGVLERVGGQEPIKVDVRMVAATNRDLTVMARENRFREDLWYRIAVFPVLLPPLRERPGDIPDLARHFAERAATRFGLSIQFPTESDLEALAAYSWPGNVRELAAVIDRAAILGNGAQLEVVKALGAPIGNTAPAVIHAAPGRPVVSMDDAMKQHIESALGATQGRIEGPRGAAALLKINPHTLRARMRKLRIDWSRFRYSLGDRRDEG
jgi:hydrogenase-4 transcriptional activator